MNGVDTPQSVMPSRAPAEVMLDILHRSSSHLEAPLEVFATLHQIFDIVNLGIAHDDDLKLWVATFLFYLGEIYVECFKELCFSLRQVYIGQQTENCEVRILKSSFIVMDTSVLIKVPTR